MGRVNQFWFLILHQIWNTAATITQQYLVVRLKLFWKRDMFKSFGHFNDLWLFCFSGYWEGMEGGSSNTEIKIHLKNWITCLESEKRKLRRRGWYWDILYLCWLVQYVHLQCRPDQDVQWERPVEPSLTKLFERVATHAHGFCCTTQTLPAHSTCTPEQCFCNPYRIFVRKLLGEGMTNIICICIFLIKLIFDRTLKKPQRFSSFM